MIVSCVFGCYFFFQAEDGIRDRTVTGVQTCALPILTGCGPIGLMSIAVAKACGSSTVFATETNEARRAMANKMGADVVINPASEDAVKRSEERRVGKEGR